MTTIEKIKAEIQRMLIELGRGYDECDWGQIAAYEHLLTFISTLESEKPMNLDFEQELYKRFGMVKDFTLGMRIAQAFYDLGCRRTAEKYDEIEYNRQRAEESVPNDLKEAAREYAFNNAEDGGEVLPRHLGFIAGSEWQKEQMMKGAVECELVCFKDRLLAVLPMKEFLWTAGDKVRIIIVNDNN